MIQDIYPSKLHNEYVNCEMTADDNCLVFSEDGRILLGEKDGQILFPKGALYLDQKTVYLFALDEERFFLAPEATAKVTAGFSFYRIREARDRFLGKELFAVFTAYHLWEWYLRSSRP